MKFKKVFCLILCICFLIIPVEYQVSAATNPYGQWQTISGITTIRCTYYAWQQAYDNTGVALPNFGNAINWYNGAKNAGYSTGTTAKAKSIAVWSTANGYGHVGYVVSVSGNKMTVNEAGLTNSQGTAPLNGNGINNGGVYNNVVGEAKYSGSSTILVGFIYLTEEISTNISITSYPSKNTITDTNAILWARVDKPSDYAVTKIGIRVRKDGDTYSNGWSRDDVPSSNYVGHTYMYPYYNLNEELDATLTHATKYWLQFYAVVDGTEFWSNEEYFTTTGSHSYTYDWDKTPTENENGIFVKSCEYCNYEKTYSMPFIKIDSVIFANNRIECRVLKPDIDPELSYMLATPYCVDGENVTAGISEDDNYKIFSFEDISALNSTSEIEIELWFGAGEIPYSISVLETKKYSFEEICNDISGDSCINAVDMVMLRVNLLGELELSTGDTNADGMVDARDLVHLKKFITNY